MVRVSQIVADDQKEKENIILKFVTMPSSIQAFQVRIGSLNILKSVLIKIIFLTANRASSSIICVEEDQATT